VVGAIFVGAAPSMPGASLGGQAPNLLIVGGVGVVIPPFAFAVDEEDAISEVDLAGDALLVQTGHSPSVAGRKLRATLELEGLDELAATTLVGAALLTGAALRQLVARSLEAILALAATLLARRLAALDVTGVKPSSGLESTSWS